MTPEKYRVIISFWQKLSSTDMKNLKKARMSGDASLCPDTMRCNANKQVSYNHSHCDAC